MARKKGDDAVEQPADLLADFFGDDDVDWLADEEEAARAAQAGARAGSSGASEQPGAASSDEPSLPVAPPPPPAFRPADVVPAVRLEPVEPEPAEPEPAEPEPEPLRPAAAGLDAHEDVGPWMDALPASPTWSPPDLVSVGESEPEEVAQTAETVAEPAESPEAPAEVPAPTEAPAFAGEMEPASAGEEDPLAARRSAPETERPGAPTHAPLEADPASSTVAPVEAGPVGSITAESLAVDIDGGAGAGVDGPAQDEPADEPAPPTEEFTADQLEATGQTPDPMVRTHAPAAPVAPDPVSFTPPLGASEDEQARAWRAVASALAREAAAHGAAGAEAGALHLAAGRVLRRRVGDLTAARAHLDRALVGQEGAVAPVSLHRERARVAMDVGRWDEAERDHAAVASAERGLAASEAWQDAAGAAAQVDAADRVVEHLRRAVAACPDDVIALSLLRDQLVPGLHGAERARLLGEVAALASGALAGELRLDQAREPGQEPAAVRAALQAALDVAPALTPALGALRAQLIADGDLAAWAERLEACAADLDGPDAAWVALRAARAHADLGAHERADALWGAISTWDGARLAALGAQLGGGRLATAARHLASSAGPAAALTAGVLFELCDECEAALAAYGRCLEQHRDVAPAAVARARLVARRDGSDPVAALRAAAEREADPDRAATRALVYALALESLGRLDEARAVAPPGPAALALRCRLGVDPLPEALAALAAVGGTSRDRADLAAALAFGVGQLPGAEARSQLAAALDEAPAHLPALVALEALLLRGGERAEALRRRRAAVEASPEGALRSALAEGGAAMAVGAGDREGAAGFVAALPAGAAADALRAALAPRDARRELAEEIAAGRAAAADASALRWWDAAEAALATAAGHGLAAWRGLVGDPVLGSFAEEMAVVAACASADLAARLDALGELVDRGVGGAVPVAIVAEELAGLGNREAFTDLARRLCELPGAAPRHALAHSAELLGEWHAAAALLAAAGTPAAGFERARLLAGPLADPVSALAELLEIAEPSLRDAAAYRAIAIAQAEDDVEALARAHAMLARGDQAAVVRAAHAGWAADAYEERRADDEALQMHRLALSLRPGSRASFEGARRLLVARGDVAGVQALYEVAPDADREGLAEELEAMGDLAAAAAAWERCLETAPVPLPGLLWLERVQVRLGDWPAVAHTLRRQRAVVRDATVLAEIDGHLAWVLGEHLPDSDEAWDVYRELAQAHPEDRVIAARVARMAGARGDVVAALETLQNLAETAPDPQEAARCRTLLGGVHASAGDAALARQAYLDALDHVPSHGPALDGLRALAERTGDRPALVAVLRRELAIAGRDRRPALLVELATVLDDGSDDVVALDAWRAAMGAASASGEAAARVLALAERTGDRVAFEEAGRQLLPSLAGRERVALLRRLGQSALDAGNRDGGIRYLEHAMSEEPPDLEAAALLRELFERLDDWAGVQRCLSVQATAAEGAARAALLAESARVALSRRQDPELADALYDRALDADPDQREARLYRAARLRAAGNAAGAVAHYDRVAERIEEGRDLDDFDDRLDLALVHHDYALALVGVGRADEAVAQLERALSLDSNHLHSLEEVARLHLQARRYDRAAEALKHLLQLARGLGDPERTAAIYVQLGLVDRARGEGDRAAKRFARALETRPSHSGALLGMALVYEDRADWENCWKSYNAVIQTGERDAVILAYLRKGRVLDERMGRLDKATEHYERCLEVDPSQPGALLRLAEILLRRGKVPEAGAVAQRALKLWTRLDATRAELLVVWAAATARAGDPAAASVALTEARATHPPLTQALGEAPLDDLDALAAGVRARLPET